MTEPGASSRRPRDPRTVTRIVLVAVLALALLGFAIDNRDDVRVGWILGDGKAPLIAVLLVTALVGGLMGWLLSHRARRDH